MSFFDRKKIGVLVLLLAVGALIFWLEQNVASTSNESDQTENSEEKANETNEKEPPPPPLEIIDEDSDSRPIAVMINNHPDTIPYHAGLQDAFVIYEIKVEGSFTRLLALYQDQDTARIGSVRSARHYFLDYALEYNAIYTHFGGSPRSYTDIRGLGVDNLDFMARSAFYRDRDLNVAQEHRAYTSMELITEELAKMPISQTGTSQHLNYRVDDIRLYAKSTLADQITIEYASSNIVSYDYQDGYYYRNINDKAHEDAGSKQQYHFKNILIKKVADFPLDNAGRLDLQTTGEGTGYFITNGRMKPIEWEKESRSKQTVYRYEDGSEVAFNDGNTIIQVIPPDTDLQFTN